MWCHHGGTSWATVAARAVANASGNSLRANLSTRRALRLPSYGSGCLLAAAEEPALDAAVDRRRCGLPAGPRPPAPSTSVFGVVPCAIKHVNKSLRGLSVHHTTTRTSICTTSYANWYASGQYTLLRLSVCLSVCSSVCPSHNDKDLYLYYFIRQLVRQRSVHITVSVCLSACISDKQSVNQLIMYFRVVQYHFRRSRLIEWLTCSRQVTSRPGSRLAMPGSRRGRRGGASVTTEGGPSLAEADRVISRSLCNRRAPCSFYQCNNIDTD